MFEVSYVLRLADPHAHRVAVEMKLPNLDRPVDLALPAWTPGAYKLVDHARNVRGLAAFSPSGDRQTVKRLDLHTWRLPATQAGTRVTYEVFADKLMIHEGQVNAEHAFLNGSAVFLGCLNALEAPCRLQVELPPGWDLVTALPPAQDGRDGYLAPNYDALADSPIEAGCFSKSTVRAQGVEWELVWHAVGDRITTTPVVCSQPPSPDSSPESRTLDPFQVDRILSAPQVTPTNVLRSYVKGANRGRKPVSGQDEKDLHARLGSWVEAIAGAITALMGPAPFSRYVAIFHECEEPGYLNGLEHRDSMVIQGPLQVMEHPEPFFTMVTHEILHAWNGQRMAPRGLFRPGCDYWKPAHTTALWVVEGITEYYSPLLCLRAGLIDAAGFLGQLGDLLDSLDATPGRRVTTLEEASFITWNFMDDRWNGAVNYYLKGALAAWALDIELRHRSAGERSLDDLMRTLWAEFGDRRAYEPQDVEELASRLAEAPLDGFFDQFLRDTADPDWEAIASRIGLAIETSKRACFGLNLSGPAGALTVKGIDAFGPAEQARLQIGDVICAIDQIKTSDALVSDIIRQAKPDDVINVAYFRQDHLYHTTVRLGSRRRHRLVPAPDATKATEQLLAQYLNLAPGGLRRPDGMSYPLSAVQT